jgi:serine/threonine protein kinase
MIDPTSEGQDASPGGSTAPPPENSVFLGERHGPLAAEEQIGAQIGRYKLLEKVGEGGFGVVYVAEQKTPIRRRVALKIIKLGMDTKSVVARFEAERQALAMMDHPNIAKVFEAGATPTGRPYFAMELVRGIPITDYCDQSNSTPAERLKLFIHVCQAIQHAHQKGIIHRDIKPNNILVTLHDGVPVPKVIDFGIAKATQGDLTDKTVYTQLQQFVGTPAYMSPEQAEMSGLDIDTRSDIYSLGVLLYELLTGLTPFDAKELMKAGVDEMRRRIRQTDPMRPSNRLSGMTGADSTETAKRRGMDTHRLITLLRGDLDWIVMKCLEKDRSRRYETANGLAVDIQRHLDNEPITARPPSSAYRFQKMVRRNKLAFGAAVAIVAALILGIIGTTVGLIRAKRAEALALQTRNDAEELSNFMLEDFYNELEPSGRLETVASLERKALDYYDGLPASLRNADTDRNRAVAQARLAFITERQGDAKEAQAMAAAALETFERLRKQGDQSEETIYGAGVSLQTEVLADGWINGGHGISTIVQRGLDLLKPAATSSQCSARIKLLYGHFLDFLGHYVQDPEQGVKSAEEALAVYASAGASDWSNLTAASAYADAADSEAREWMELGRLDNAERLEKQSLKYAEGALVRRPGHMWAMEDIAQADILLAEIAVDELNEADAGKYLSAGQEAAENFVRTDPSIHYAWRLIGEVKSATASDSFRLGHVARAIQEARAAIDWHPEGVASSQLSPAQKADFCYRLAVWEAQRGDRAAAEEALLDFTRCREADASNGTPGSLSTYDKLYVDVAARQIKMAFGEAADVEAMAKASLQLIEETEKRAPGHLSLTGYRSAALWDLADADIHQKRHAQADAAARAMLALDFHQQEEPYFVLNNIVVGDVFLAQAQAGQGRKAEAMKTLEPAIAQLRQFQVQGVDDVYFRQVFARALYVQSLAEPSDPNGSARSRDELDEAMRLLRGLSNEAAQLHDSKELVAWIADAQAKGGAGAAATKKAP